MFVWFLFCLKRWYLRKCFIYWMCIHIRCIPLQIHTISWLRLKPVKGTLSLHSMFAIDEFKLVGKRLNVSVTDVSIMEICKQVVMVGRNMLFDWRERSIYHKMISCLLQMKKLVRKIHCPQKYLELLITLLRWWDLSPQSWYIGKVLEMDNSDNEVYVSFINMSEVSEVRVQITFKWPQPADEFW